MEQLALPLLEVNQAAIDQGGIQLQGANLNLQPLYDAASSGNWGRAEEFLNQNPTANITRPKLNGMTILHVAATMGHAGFITSLFRSGHHFPIEAMRQLDNFKWSALHYAASYGHLDVVRVLVGKESTLTQILDGDDKNTPLHQAANNAANKRVLLYLAEKTNNDAPAGGLADNLPFSGVKGAQLINALAAGGYYDICLYLLKKYPKVADYLLTNKEVDLITTLIRSPDQFQSGSSLNFLERCIYHCIPSVPSVLRAQQEDAQNFSTKSIPSVPPVSGAEEHPQNFSTESIPSVPRPVSGAQEHAQNFSTKIKLWISKAIAYVPVFNGIKDVKYKHQRIEELLQFICEKMSAWDANAIEAYFKRSPSVLYYSAKNGVIETISAFIKHAPDYMDKYSPNVDIILWSIEHRRENVFNFMMERDVFVKVLPEYTEEEDASSSATSSLHNRETYLHAAAKLPPLARLTSVSSPAMQMQRELQWFQGVEKVVRPTTKTAVNKNGQTPRELFTTAHEDLAQKAEKWLKDTANSCMVVAALIITVVFTAAFTVPGGDIDGTGIALFLNRTDFMVFIVSDAIGMFSSATSILMFLSILTARYAVDDFNRALPTRLILGLVSLVIALASMLVAFGVALYIILIPKYTWIVIFPIILITSIPVILFIILQLPLIYAMVKSTFIPCRSILKPMKTPW